MTKNEEEQLEKLFKSALFVRKGSGPDMIIFVLNEQGESPALEAIKSLSKDLSTTKHSISSTPNQISLKFYKKLSKGGIARHQPKSIREYKTT